MAFNPLRHHRRSIRLSGYDYSQNGAYFVTVCTRNREPLFGSVIDGHMQLNDWGASVGRDWEWLAEQYPQVELDAWVVMPNHLHGILLVTDVDAPGTHAPSGRGGSRTAPTTADPSVGRKSLGRLIGAFKTVSTKHVNALRETPGATLWQRNYYETIIRSETMLDAIREYVVSNPARWSDDADNPANLRLTRRV